MKAFKILLPMMTVLALSACGEGSNSSSSQSSAKPEAPVDTSSGGEQKKDTSFVSSLPDTAPTYTVAVFLNSPYHYKNEFGQSIGYDVDLMRAIGEEAGFKVQFRQEPFKNTLPSLDAGTSQLAISGLSLTPERQQKYSASKPYSKAKAGYMVLTSSPNQTKEQLNDKKIGVLGGANLAKILTENSNAQAIPQPTMFLAFKTIFTKKSDAVFGFEANLRHESKQFEKEQSFNFVPFSDDVYTAIFANKNNPKLIADIDSALENIKKSGKYDEISKKWFGDHVNNFTVK